MNDLSQTGFRVGFYHNTLLTNKIHRIELLDGCLIGQSEFYLSKRGLRRLAYHEKA